MPFDITRFLINRAVIERQGVPEADVNRLALVPSVLAGPLGYSVATAAVIGQNNAAPPPAVATPAPSPGGTPGTPSRVTIPNMAGWRLQDATDRLEKLKLEAHIGRDPRAEADRVLRTEPPAGSSVAQGTRVVVFAGPRDGGIGEEQGPAELRSMEGWRVDDAVAEIEARGLVALIGTDPRGEADRVYRTDPGPGPVAAGSQVTVFTGPASQPKAAKKAPARKAAARKAPPRKAQASPAASYGGTPPTTS